MRKNPYTLPDELRAQIDWEAFFNKRLENEFLSPKERNEYQRLLNKEIREKQNEQKTQIIIKSRR